MKSLKTTLAAALVGTAALALVACGPDAETDDSMMADDTAMMDEMAAGNIVDVAQSDDTFSTLVAAVTAAGLGDVLSGEGPFTVFAPTNEAFAKVDAATMTELTTNDTETLGKILTYHVVEGTIDAATLIGAIEEAGDAGFMITTVGGGTLTATLVDGGVVLTDANGGMSKVIATDVEASNGVIHAVDTVLMP